MLDIENMNQGDIAKTFSVDRSSIHQWQRKGLPYIAAPRGKEARYIGPLAFRWWLGRRVRRKWGVKLNGAVDAVAFAHALIRHEGGDTYAPEKVVADLKRCGVTADQYHQRLGYYQAIVEQRTGG